MASVAPPITQCVIDLRDAPSVALMLRVATTILAQRRTVEVAHSIGCLMAWRPGPVARAEFGADLSDRLVDAAAQLARFVTDRDFAQRAAHLLGRWASAGAAASPP